MSDLAITLLILAASVALFVWNRLPVGIVALAVALALWATGVLSIEQSLAGFGSTTVVLIAALFVVAEGLDSAGITTWAGEQVMKHAGASQTKLLVYTMLVGALLSALITPNGAAAALIPMAVILSVRMGALPSRLLMPLAFSTHAGSLLVLTGSPVNVLISEAAEDAGHGGLRFFEFARVGIPLTVGTILIVVGFGSRLLPARAAKTLARDLSRLPQALQRDYLGDDRLLRLRVEPGSPLIGRPGRDAAFGPDHGDGSGDGHGDGHRLRLIGAFARDQPLPYDGPLAAGATLVVRGRRDEVERFAAGNGLSLLQAPSGEPATGLVGAAHGVAEVMVAPRSPYIGDTVFPGMTTESGELVVLGVRRSDRDRDRDLDGAPAVLQAGDALLLGGRWEALDEQTRDPNVVLVDAPDAIRRQAAPRGPRTLPALLIMGGMVLLLTTGLIPAVAAGLLAAIAMVLSGVVTVEQAHRSISWTTLVLVAGMIPLSAAITETGAADLLATTMIGIVGGLGPWALLLGLFLISATVGQLISNTAIALILIPIALSISEELGVSPMPMLMAVNVAAAAALLTPVATPANMMVMGPGGYRFGDYAKLGLPLMLLYGAVAVLLVPVWWPW